MSLTARQRLEQLIRLGRKWRWYGIVPAVLVATLGISYGLIVPNSYTASATVSVDENSPTNPLLRDLNVDQRRQERLAVVAEAIHSYAILEGTVQDVGAGTVLADSTDFLTYLRGSLNDWLVRERPLSVSQAVDTLDGGITIRQWGTDLIQVSYTGLDPKTAANISNSLVGRFIEHTTMARRRGAQATVEFIAEQVATYKSRLEGSEVLLRSFREENLEARPNRFDAQLQQLATTRAEEVTLQINLREIEQRSQYLERELAETEKTIVAEMITGANPVKQEIEGQLIQARVELASLQTNYTERHPAVIQLREKIADLEAALERGDDTTVTSQTSARNPAYDSLERTLQNTRIEQESMRLRLEALRERIVDMEGAISGIPEQEQYLAQLARDSQVNERIYELLLQKLEEAKISQRLAEQERGSEQFRIIDPARAPEAPTGPDRPMLLFIALVLATGAGVGSIMARNYVDESYDNGEELAAAFDVPCLAVIPRLDKAA